MGDATSWTLLLVCAALAATAWRQRRRIGKLETLARLEEREGLVVLEELLKVLERKIHAPKLRRYMALANANANRRMREAASKVKV